MAQTVSVIVNAEDRERLAAVIGERLAAQDMIEPLADRPRAITLGADRGYDAADFVEELRSLNVRPHVAQNTFPAGVAATFSVQAGDDVSTRCPSTATFAIIGGNVVGMAPPEGDRWPDC